MGLLFILINTDSDDYSVPGVALSGCIQQLFSAKVASFFFCEIFFMEFRIKKERSEFASAASKGREVTGAREAGQVLGASSGQGFCLVCSFAPSLGVQGRGGGKEGQDPLSSLAPGSEAG